MLPLAVGLSPWIVSHWFRAALLLVALALLGMAWFRRASPTLLWSLGIGGSLLGTFSLGGFIPFGYAFWLFGIGLTVFLLLIATLLISGAWSREIALLTGASTLLGLGGLALNGIETSVAETALSVSEMRIRSPWWLLLMCAVPVVIFPALRRLNRHELRPWIALGLRLLGLTILIFALSEPFFSQASRAMTVLFVVDRSLSIPEDPGFDPAQPNVKIDNRSRRVVRFINDAVRMRGTSNERDMAGLVVFGKRPRLELPPGITPPYDILKEMPSIEDPGYTDIGSALKLALASFPEGTARRIVLVSDGNENLGNAEEQALLAKSLGVQIDILPLAAGQVNTEEILVERVDAPAVTNKGDILPIKVLVRSHNPKTVVGRLVLKQITDKEGTLAIRLGNNGLGIEVETLVAPLKGVRLTDVTAGGPASRAGLEVGEDITQTDGVAITDRVGFVNAIAKKKAGDVAQITVRRTPEKIVGVRDPAELFLGPNIFSFVRPLTDEQRSYTYEAEFIPRGTKDDKGKFTAGLPGDRTQNNRASTHVVARGQGRILLLENKPGDHADLVERLVAAGKGKFKVVAEAVDVLENYRTRDKLAVFLSNFDCVILANVPADRISEEHQEVIRSNTHDQGCGLVMIGGPESFGAGGWQNTPVEKALPVDSDIKSLKVQGKGGLVMIMHASEMADGNRWQKKIAKLAVERLGPTDEVGIIDYGFGCKWPVPMQEAGPNRRRILAAIDGLMPGDMPDFDPALKMAFDALNDKKKDFGAKHIIIISDGDPIQQDKKLLAQIKAAKITIATVGVATHGAPQDAAMEDIATAMPGNARKKRYYKVDDPKKLPAIYIKETRMVSQAFLHRKEFQPILRFRSEPIRQIPDLAPLGGFVRTTPKPSPLVEVPILSPRFNDQDFPILAHWNYGLGKGVAFTSDAGKPEMWCRKWKGGDVGDGIYARFWEQVISWSLRPTENNRLVMTAEIRDGKIRIVLDAKKEDGKRESNLKITAGLTPPSGKGGEPGKKKELVFTETNSGTYEAEVRADEAGSYFIAAQVVRKKKMKDKDGKEIEVEERESVRAGVTLPYSPEYSDLETNTGLLERIRETTNGREFVDDEEALIDAAKSGAVFRAPETTSRFSLPFHYWLLFLAATLLLLDVAVRRLAFDPQETAANAAYLWARLRGKPVEPPTKSTTVERLSPRTASAGAERRWEGSSSKELPKQFPDSPSAPKPETPKGPGGVPDAKPTAQPAGDTLENLKKAKKRVWDEKKDKPDNK